MSKIRHEWYQTDNEVVLSVFIRNVKQDELKFELQERSLSLTVPLPTGTDVVFDLDPLAHPVDVQASSYRVLTPKIEVKLVKKDKGLKWGKIEGEETAIGSTMGPITEKADHSYPSSSKKRTNWDQFVQESNQEEEQEGKQRDKDPNAGGDVAVNELFQKLYADATDDQRRAMIKSYQLSNGTSLSTNWEEVAKGKGCETVPPDSMVAKKWGA